MFLKDYHQWIVLMHEKLIVVKSKRLNKSKPHQILYTNLNVMSDIILMDVSVNKKM